MVGVTQRGGGGWGALGGSMAVVLRLREEEEAPVRREGFSAADSRRHSCGEGGGTAVSTNTKDVEIPAQKHEWKYIKI